MLLLSFKPDQAKQPVFRHLFSAKSMMPTESLFDLRGTPRQTFERFSTGLQPLITLISGIPGRGETPVLEIKPWMAIAIDLVKLAVGVLGGGWAFRHGGASLLLLPFCWILVVNAARSLTSDAHYAGHNCVTRRANVDWWIGELLSTLVLSPTMKDYAPGHNQRHHGRDGIVTLSDPDLQLMFSIGFETGRSTRWYVWRLYLALVSPRYHVLYLRARLASNFITADFGRLVLAWAFHGAIATLVWRYGLLTDYAVAWLVPIFPLYAISAALQFPSEHLWLFPDRSNEHRGSFLRRLSHGRFFLVPAPRAELQAWQSVLAWSLWLVRMLPLMFERFFVCVSILPAHDYHHRHALTKRWPMEPYLRARSIEEGAKEFRDYYGLRAVYVDQFQIWSSLPREAARKNWTTLRWVERMALTWFPGLRCK
ncbi:fatty acid desaturase [Burkholderia glumae]|uniref:fatty acid desaturase n=1 Tax=Burkholderia glumae TaxID=337 RepID=UPI0009B788CC|nr:fatty acid desaturase [Burkholderia glumae]